MCEGVGDVFEGVSSVTYMYMYMYTSVHVMCEGVKSVTLVCVRE